MAALSVNPTHRARPAAPRSLAGLLAWLLAAPAAHALSIVVDTDRGLLSTDRTTWVSTLDWKGTTITARGLGADGAYEFLVHGDFNVGAPDYLSAWTGAQRGAGFLAWITAGAANAGAGAGAGGGGRAAPAAR